MKKTALLFSLILFSCKEEEIKNCSTNQNCADTEVCVWGFCLDAWSDETSPKVRVTEYSFPSCDNTFCSEYYIIFNDVDITAKNSCDYECPRTWSNIPYVMFEPSIEKESFEILISDNNNWRTICWPFESEDPIICLPEIEICNCGPVPKKILHEGSWKGYINNYYINLEFNYGWVKHYE